MQIKLKKHASRVEEAVNLCKLMTSNYHYEEAKKRILEKYQFEVFDVSSMMDKRTLIEKEFVRIFVDKKEVFEHYFKKRSANIYLADLLLQLPYLQTEKRKCRYVYDEELNRSSAFMDAFLELELIDETYTKSVNNFEELSLLLETIDMDKEDKWLIQSTYLHLEDEMKRFVSLVNQIVDWLAAYEDIMCEEERIFNDYWGDVIQRMNMADYLSQKLNIDIGRKTNTIWLIPSFFNCQAIHSKAQKDTIYIYIGMLLDESFSLEKKYETPGLICSQLRLLSDPSKFEILCAIKQQSYYGSELASKFNLSTPTISHHMRALENAGFIKIEKKDNKTYYSLDHERLTLFMRQVENMLLMREEEK